MSRENGVDTVRLLGAGQDPLFFSFKNLYFYTLDSLLIFCQGGDMYTLFVVVVVVCLDGK